MLGQSRGGHVGSDQCVEHSSCGPAHPPRREVTVVPLALTWRSSPPELQRVRSTGVPPSWHHAHRRTGDDRPALPTWIELMGGLHGIDHAVVSVVSHCFQNGNRRGLSRARDERPAVTNLLAFAGPMGMAPPGAVATQRQAAEFEVARPRLADGSVALIGLEDGRRRDARHRRSVNAAAAPRCWPFAY